MTKTQQSIKINEIFYSLQGEGNRAGEPSIFIRVQGCSAHNACAKKGIKCDTEFISGKEYTLKEIHNYIKEYKGHWIIWTGGEPCDQIDDDTIKYFKDRGYKQALETSGIKTPPNGLDYICVSPKVAEHIILKNFKERKINELRWVRRYLQQIPPTKINADYYYLSPHSDGFNINQKNLEWCTKLCKENPKWRLSIQQHKIWNVR